MSQVTILFLAANPLSSGSLALDEEVRDIDERIQRRSCPVDLTLRPFWAVRPVDVQRALNETRPAVVHFSGHGTATSGLMFHDVSGPKMVNGRGLRRLFSAFKDDLRIVVLNACYSKEQAEEISKEIEYVVGMESAISDRAARAFSAAFYQALAYDCDVRNAFEQGLAGMHLEGVSDLEAPHLLVRNGSSPAHGRPSAWVGEPPTDPDAAPAPRHRPTNGRRRRTKSSPSPYDDSTMLDRTITLTSPTRQARSTDAVEFKAPRLIVAFECGRPRVPGLRLSLADVDEVIVGRGPERAWTRANSRLLLSVPDVEMSRLHTRLIRQGMVWNADDLDSKNGTYVDGIRVTRATLEDGSLIELGRTVFLYRDQAHQMHDLGDRDLAAEDDSRPEVFRTLSLSLEGCWAALELIAATKVPVLVTGQTGTGKDLVARAIHARSRRSGEFVPVNCGALPRTLIESELFGVRAGAYTDSRAREGLVRKADGGTLFLDEVAELPEESQVALLRLLQEGEVRPVGATDAIHVDVRVVAATHQDLNARIEDGRFRRDLYARLAGYHCAMPPLADRIEDIGSLIGRLLHRIDDSRPFEFSLQAALILFDYSFPMNVRELEQALCVAAALAESGDIKLAHFPDTIRALMSAPHKLAPEDKVLRGRVLELLRLHRGDFAPVSRALGRTAGHVRRLCRRFGIDLGNLGGP